MAARVSALADVRLAVERTASRAKEWSSLPASKKLQYLRTIQTATEQCFQEWGQRSVQLRKWDGPDNAPLIGNAFLMGSGTFGMHLDIAIQTYSALASSGKPPKCSVREFGGQSILKVFPNTVVDQMLWPMYKAEMWVQPGKPPSQGELFRSSTPGLAAILGAGNYEAPVDILTKMFAENKVAVYKSHPTMGPAADSIFGRMFKCLTDDGYLALVSGDVDVGETLLNHDAVEEVLMTGGCKVYDSIVWGPPSEQAANKRAGTRKFTKKFEAELGAVSPWVVVPGRWPGPLLRHQVEFLCGIKSLNGGASCASPQVVVVDRKWPQCGEFLNGIRQALQRTRPTPYWYPGTPERQKQFADSISNAEWLPANSQYQTVFMPEVTLDSFVLKNEAFAPVLAVLALDCGNDPERFLAEATKVINDVAMGSLSCTLIIDPLTEWRHKAALNQAIANIKRGTIGVNEWGGTGIFFGGLGWGACHGRHTPEDIQSGQGFLGNHFLIDYPEKSVLYGTFFSLNHAKAPDNSTRKLFERMCWCALRPTVGRALTVAAATCGI